MTLIGKQSKSLALKCLLGIALSAGLLVQPAQAASKAWVGTVSTDWATAGNWSPSGVPASGDTVTIGQGKTVNVPSNVTVAGLTRTAPCREVAASP